MEEEYRTELGDLAGPEQFIELDHEIAQYETNFLNPISSNSSSKPLLRRLFASIRDKLLDRHEDMSRNVSLKNDEKAFVTCRICENIINADTLEGHTDWCSKYQDCVLRKDRCAKYLNAIVEIIKSNRTRCKEEDKLLGFIEKALEVEEEIGKLASVRLAKLLYKIAKLNSDNAVGIDSALLKRVRYLIEQKRLLADRFAELKPTRLSSHYIYSSCTDSSLDSPSSNDPNIIVEFVDRPTTPVTKLTTMLSTLLGRPQSSSRSPQFGSSLTRSSILRTHSSGPIPQINDFEVIKPVSRGAFGSVYLAKKKKTEDLYAIKVLRKSDLIRKNMTSHVLTERRMLSLAQAPFIVMLYYAFESRDHLFLVMEYLIGGDLSSKLQADGRFTEGITRFYIAELVQTVEYLHDHGIIHRDIKPDNMLLDSNGHLKLTDFGLANLHTKPYKGRMLGTPEYIAPEMVRRDDHGPAVDWWAVGVCLFEFLVGAPPFGGDTAEEVFESILSFIGIDWEGFEEFHLSTDIRDLIDKLLDPNPNTRFGSIGVKSHSFFSGIDWTNLRSNDAPIKPTPIDQFDTSNFDARNKRYESIGLPGSFLEGELIEEGMDSISGVSTPSKFKLNGRTSSSLFDGFNYKNIDLLSRINRKLSSTPTSFLSPGPASRASSAGNLSDDGFNIT